MRMNLVAFDETSEWKESIAARAGRIFGVYAYNPDEVTHCCEVTASYTLFPIDFFTENRLDDELYDEMCGACSHEDVMYVHASRIDRMAEKNGEFTVKHECTDPNKFDDLDEALEHYRGNSYLG